MAEFLLLFVQREIRNDYQWKWKLLQNSVMLTVCSALRWISFAKLYAYRVPAMRDERSCLFELCYWNEICSYVKYKQKVFRFGPNCIPEILLMIDLEVWNSIEVPYFALSLERIAKILHFQDKFHAFQNKVLSIEWRKFRLSVGKLLFFQIKEFNSYYLVIQKSIEYTYSRRSFRVENSQYIGLQCYLRKQVNRFQSHNNNTLHSDKGAVKVKFHGKDFHPTRASNKQEQNVDDVDRICEFWCNMLVESRSNPNFTNFFVCVCSIRFE